MWKAIRTRAGNSKLKPQSFQQEGEEQLMTAAGQNHLAWDNANHHPKDLFFFFFEGGDAMGRTKNRYGIAQSNKRRAASRIAY